MNDENVMGKDGNRLNLFRDTASEDGESLVSFIAPELYTVKIPLSKLLKPRVKLIIAFCILVLLAGFVSVLFCPLAEFHTTFQKGAAEPKIHVKKTTTWSTIIMFWESKTYILAFLYFNGVYLVPFIHIILIVYILFANLRPEKRRFMLVRMRFFAKLTIQPVIMSLVNITAFDASATDDHLRKEKPLLFAEIFLQPNRGMILQIILGPALIALETWLLHLNKLGPPPRTSIFSTRVSLFAAGASFALMCCFLFQSLIEFETGGIFGLMMTHIDSHKLKKSNVNELILPNSIQDIRKKHGLDSAEIYFITAYFYIILVVFPCAAIVLECLWRLLNADPDNYQVITLNPWKRILRKVRRIICMYYLWDILVVTLIVAAIELPNVSDYLARNLLSEQCEELSKRYPEISCYSISGQLNRSTWLLLVHVLMYYCSAGLPTLYRGIFVLRRFCGFTDKLYPADQMAHSLLPNGFNYVTPGIQRSRNVSRANSEIIDTPRSPFDPGLSPIQPAKNKLTGDSDMDDEEAMHSFHFRGHTSPRKSRA